MPGSMSQADLAADLRGLLADAATKFTGAGDRDLHRHLALAAADLGRVRRRTLLGFITLVADQPNYAAPADMIGIKFSLWGRTQQRRRKLWESNAVRTLPRLSMVGDPGAMELWIEPSPTAAQIADLGSKHQFFYYAAHSVGVVAADTTVAPADRWLLLIRAAAHALQELAANGVSKPVSLGSGGVGSMPKNGTPGALSEQLMKLFEQMAA